MGEHEVTARTVGKYSLDDAFEALSPVGLFEYGREYVGEQPSSQVWRFIVTAANEEQACRVVTTAMHSIPGLVVHDVRPGPHEPVDSDDAEEERFDAFLSRLDESSAREVMRRLSAHVNRTVVGHQANKIRLPTDAGGSGLN